ncbi:unnamed protein product [Durusdinium trenchii]|uniref:Helicase ATP-binding domain-containing protein n=1 Tax=Durusdinium trenchii TaxID=1381693 RepID=A0ABP0RYF5_9DINO
MAFQPRDYQLKSLDAVRQKNTIVSLPTGGGKTFVAVLALDHFLRDGLKAMFVVPTRVLVQQQAQYCRDRCQLRVRVVELSGGEMESWDDGRRLCAKTSPIILKPSPSLGMSLLVDVTLVDVTPA